LVPTWITARVTSIPFSFRAPTCSFTSSLIAWEIAFPSINCANSHTSFHKPFSLKRDL